MVVVFLWLTLVQFSFQRKQQHCSVVITSNSTDPTDVLFYNRMQQLIGDEKIMDPISTYLKTGRLNISILLSINFDDIVKLNNISDLNYNSGVSIYGYNNIDRNKSLSKLINMFYKQNVNSISNRVRSDEIVNVYLQKRIKFMTMMDIRVTVTSQKIFLNFIEFHFIGEKACSQSPDNRSKQRHKRSSDCASKKADVYKRQQ